MRHEDQHQMDIDEDTSGQGKIFVAEIEKTAKNGKEEVRSGDQN